MSAKEDGAAFKIFEQSMALPREEREGYILEAAKAAPEVAKQALLILEYHSVSKTAELVALPESDLLTDLSENWEDIRELAHRGGMAKVFVATRVDGGEKVVLKVIPASGIGSSAKRFQREASAIQRLHHPGVVSLRSFGRYKNHLVIEQEYLEGARHLDDYINDLADWDAKLRVFESICDVVGYLAEFRIVHRDLKPSNILVMPDGTPRVIDFGIALDHSITTLTREGIAPGTFWYMSPEQHRADHGSIDSRSDLYSIGILLYEAFVGEPPHDRKLPDQEFVRRVCQEPPRSPKKLKAKLSRGFGAVLIRTVECDPRDRYSSAAALKEDLRRLRCGEPVQAKGRSWISKVLRWSQRHPEISLSAAVLVLIFGIFAVVIGAQARRQAAETIIQKERQVRVTEFLTDVLLRPSPRNQGRSVTMLEAIRRSAATIDEHAGEDNLSAAMMHSAVGVTFLQLAEYSNAEVHLVKAMKLFDSQLGPEAEKTLVARKDLLILRMRTLPPGETLDEFEQLLSDARRFLGSTSEVAAEAERCIALEYGAMGQPHIAAARMREALRNPGAAKNPVERIIANRNLAVFLTQSGEPVEALAILAEVISGLEAVGWDKGSDYLGARIERATALYKVGEVESAIDIWKEALLIAPDIGSEAHPLMINAKLQLGTVLSLRSRATHPEDLALAEVCLSDVIEVMEELLDGENLQLLQAFQKLGVVKAKLGHHEEARELLELSFERRSPAAFISTLAGAVDLAAFYYSQREYPATIDCLEPLLNKLPEQVDPDSANLHVARELLESAQRWERGR